MAETEDLAERVDQLERVVLALSEMMAEVHTHHGYKMGELLKPLREREYKRRDMKAEA